MDQYPVTILLIAAVTSAGIQRHQNESCVQGFDILLSKYYFDVL